MFCFFDSTSNQEDKVSLTGLFEQAPSLPNPIGQMPIPSLNSIGNQLTAGKEGIEPYMEDINVFNSAAEEANRKHSSDDSEGKSQLQKKRMEGKVRSKKSRDRKRVYLEELEMEVKQLRKENIRLQNLIHMKEEQNTDKIDSQPTGVFKQLSKLKESISEKLINPDTMKYKEETTVKVKDQVDAMKKLMFGNTYFLNSIY